MIYCRRFDPHLCENGSPKYPLFVMCVLPVNDIVGLNIRCEIWFVEFLQFFADILLVCQVLFIQYRQRRDWGIYIFLYALCSCKI